MKARKFIVCAALTFALASPMSVLASPADASTADKITVSYADLNINHAAGAKVLYRRLQQASETACSVDTYQKLGSLERLAKTQKCYEVTLDEAVAKINSAELRKIHSS